MKKEDIAIIYGYFHGCLVGSNYFKPTSSTDDDSDMCDRAEEISGDIAAFCQYLVGINKDEDEDFVEMWYSHDDLVFVVKRAGGDLVMQIHKDLGTQFWNEFYRVVDEDN